MSVEITTGVTDFLALTGDDLASGESGIVNDRANKPFGEQMLDEHFLDGFSTKIRVYRVLAERQKALERFLKIRVGFLRLLNLHQSIRQVRNTLLELLDCRVEVLVGGFSV